ncbi:MAG: DUF4384 domain-containing protein [Symploca sp. SIO1C4]|uniref:DUF4384 domain-containing protein n=1 Tax=Symploca sp. SIO1C4 TaxID=2607765 RepID=A0A6B3NFJ0_9CYAN|nr:DUF4384 domain-containing protein [Symploca sp. SIO1C4]
MSGIQRRHFLQIAGSSLATVGLSHIDIITQGDRYGKILAKNTPRKLALLVGINQYPEGGRFTNLSGCVTDVDLQQQLLIHRFGFNPKDIVRLTSSKNDQQPTRDNIITAFEEHLIKQAKLGDIVVFHFSGHGSRLPEYDRAVRNCLKRAKNSTLVPADLNPEGWANDIMGRTLFLLVSALNTENVTLVLDSCYSGGGTRGNFRVRSITGHRFRPSPQELEYQQQWLRRLQLSPTQLASRRCAGVAKGVVIASAQANQLAADADFSSFHAGAFTYYLTLYLWQQTATVSSAIAQVSNALPPQYSQGPLADGNVNEPVYFLQQPAFSTDAVITRLKGNQATVWLGGVNQQILPTFDSGATFTIFNHDGEAMGEVELASRQGLIGETVPLQGQLRSSLQPGSRLQVSSRVIPADLKLSIGLDPSLASEGELAKEAFSAIRRLEVVTAQSGDIPYPGGVSYILSRMTTDYLSYQQGSDLPDVGNIGLFTQGLEVVPSSFGQAGETVSAAVKRLEAKLKSLLAIHILKKTLNSNSSQLDVEVSLNLVGRQEEIIAKVSTSTSRSNSQGLPPVYPRILPLKQLFQFKVQNHDSSNLYFTIILIDSGGELVVVFPYHWPVSNENMEVKAGQTLLVGNSEELKLQAIASGSGEALVILSRSPLTKAVKLLQSLAQEQNRSSGPVVIERSPVDVVGSLLDDLSDYRSSDTVTVQQVSAAEIATLSITFEVGSGTSN